MNCGDSSEIDKQRRKGRAASSNPANRFETTHRVAVDDGWDIIEDLPPVRTHVSVETPRKVITRNTSPDLSFDRSINPYRGCEHGCIYCFARPSHAFLGLSPGLDFETRLIARPKAPAVLERELANVRYVPKVIAIGTNTDPYQPIERDHGIMRRILQVLQAHNHPVGVVTKGTLIERDIDILGEMGRRGLARVGISITTLNAEIARKMEPRVPSPVRRLRVIERLVSAGCPVRIMVSPVIPALTDHEIEDLSKNNRPTPLFVCKEKMESFCRRLESSSMVDLDVKESFTTTSPPKPLSMTKLQSLITSASAIEVLAAGQRLYEQGYTSYPRTEESELSADLYNQRVISGLCSELSKWEQFGQAALAVKAIHTNNNNKYPPFKPKFYTTSKKAHDALHPVMSPQPGTLTGLDLEVRGGLEKYLSLSPKFQLYGGAQLNLSAYNLSNDQYQFYGAGVDFIGGLRYNLNDKWSLSSEIIAPLKYNWSANGPGSNWEAGVKWQPLKLNFRF
mgnify:CR=1 FL=1